MWFFWDRNDGLDLEIVANAQFSSLKELFPKSYG